MTLPPDSLASTSQCWDNHEPACLLGLPPTLPHSPTLIAGNLTLRASHMLGKLTSTDLHLQPLRLYMRLQVSGFSFFLFFLSYFILETGSH